MAAIRAELHDKHARIAQLKTEFDKLKAHLEAERMIQARVGHRDAGNDSLQKQQLLQLPLILFSKRFDV